MGNPIKLEVELSDQVREVDTASQQDNETPEVENLEAPLWTKGRSECYSEIKAQCKESDQVASVPHAQITSNGNFSTTSSDSGEMGKPLLTDSSELRSEIPTSSNNAEQNHVSQEDDRAVVTAEMIRDMEIKYAPYVRHDTYGTMGTGPVSVWEKACLFVALIVIAPIRVILLMTVLITYYAICRVCTLFRLPGVEVGQENYGHLTGVRRTMIVNSGRFFSRLLLFIFGFYSIKVTQKNPDVMRRLHLGLGESESDLDNEGLLDSGLKLPGAIVSNHVSYIDILYHMSASFPSFVAKRSVARLPLVGLISKCMGCVYVQRESKSSDFKGVSGTVADRLQAAHTNPAAPKLLLFPEGTTTNGDYLLPFKTGAFLARTPVAPVILKYPYRRFSPAWETITGNRHLVLLLCQFVNHLEVVRLPVYCPTAKECSDSKLYSQNVRHLMSTEGDLIMSDIGLCEKRVYHAALRGKIYSSESS